MGYYFIFWGLELRNDAQMSRALDEDYYDATKAVTFQIPIALPYQYDDPQFVRVEGKFSYGGESYRLVKQKYAHDTLTVVCIKDEKDQSIQQALSEFVGTFTDHATDVPGAKALSVFLKEYLIAEVVLGNRSSGWMLELERTNFHTVIEETHPACLVQPPEA